MSYTVEIDYKEFRKYLVEGDDGSWGDDYFEKTFAKYVDDGLIRIEYKYGDYQNGKSLIKWRVADYDGDENTNRVYAKRYTGSSIFAMWWRGACGNCLCSE
jgi:hypothetical protein